jgi:hypothetical protein
VGARASLSARVSMTVVGFTTALMLAGCGGQRDRQVTPSSDRLVWAYQLGRSESVLDVGRVPDPALVRKVEAAARAGRARVLDVTVLDVTASTGHSHVPVVTLTSADPASYMKHHLGRFLEQIGYTEPNHYGFVELFDDRGRFAWSAGRFPNGGMVHPRPDLDQCSPVSHSQPPGRQPLTCPAD